MTGAGRPTKGKAPAPVIGVRGTLGILGGGQLGRMLTQAATRFGINVHIYCPEEHAPALPLAAKHTRAPYDSEEDLLAFARAVDAVTFEFENVPYETVAFLAEHTTVRPGARALRVAQDRLQEKTFLNGIGIPTTGFAPVSNGGELVSALQRMGLPSILKTRRFGYDGKGQVRIDELSERDAAWEAMKRNPAILEAFVPFVRELSVIVARDAVGEVQCYDPSANEHENHILRRSVVPAPISREQAATAQAIATRIVGSLDYVGVMGVELFELEDGSLVVNEIAPRVHNSGHWTMDACTVGQFEQHLRAVAGWPLGAPARHSDAVMENILGAEIENWPQWLEQPDCAVHVYGKKIAREGRKMGHMTRLFRRGSLSSQN